MSINKKLKRIVKALMLSVSLVILPGCFTTVPVKMPFPEAPTNLLQQASDLKSLPEDKKSLSDLLENANENYSMYYTLKEKYNAWIEWYNEQKRIHDKVK
jgi:hypothetical protein